MAFFDARYDTPPAAQNIVGGHVLIDQRIDGARVVAPNDVWRSILLLRVDTVGGYQMPPLARNTVDKHGVALLREWIQSLPGRACCRRRRFCHPAAIFKAGRSHVEHRAGREDLLHTGRDCADHGRPALLPTVPSGRTDHRPREGVRARLHKKRHGEGVFPLQPVAFTSRPAQDQLADKNRANSGSRREAITMPCGVVFYTVYG